MLNQECILSQILLLRKLSSDPEFVQDFQEANKESIYHTLKEVLNNYLELKNQ